MTEFDVCPRCGELGLEHLETHSYCVECNYSPDLDGYIKVDEEDAGRKLNEDNEYELLNNEGEIFYEYE